MSEAVELLQRLVRIDTVNPPGNERPAQELLAGLLAGAGFDVRLVGRLEERPNLVARLDGDADGPVLCLLSHVDTVLAHADEWSHGPWSGDLADGFVWGRGTLDMKSQTAAEVAAAVGLARSGWRPARGALLVIALVDEEVGGEEGARWLCEHHPELARCDYVLNEGGGSVIPFDGRRVYGVCVAEKGVFRFRVITDGVAGHASYPRIGDNALLKMAPILEALAGRQPGHDLTAAPRALLEGLVGPFDGSPDEALSRVRAGSPALAALIEPMLGVTLAPTRIRASEKINVLPSQAQLDVDCRVPPGLGEDVARRRIAEVLGDSGYRLEFTETVVGNGSPVESELMDAIREWVAAADPGAIALPTVLPGFTDSRTWRETFPDCIAYGFFPHRHMTLFETAPLVHAADERIDLRDVDLAAAFFADVVRRVLG